MCYWSTETLTVIMMCYTSLERYLFLFNGRESNVIYLVGNCQTYEF